MKDRDALMLALAVLCEADEFVWHPDAEHYAAIVRGKAYTVTFAQWDELTRRGMLSASEHEVRLTYKGRETAKRWCAKMGIRIKGGAG